MKKYRSIIAIVSVAVAIIVLFPGSLRAESKLVEQSGLSGGIVVALDFPDGKAATAGSLAISTMDGICPISIIW